MLLCIAAVLVLANAVNVGFLRIDPSEAVYAFNAAVLSLAARSQVVIHPRGASRVFHLRWAAWVAFLLLQAVGFSWCFANVVHLAYIPHTVTYVLFSLGTSCAYFAIVHPPADSAREPTLVLTACTGLAIGALLYIVQLHTEVDSVNRRLLLAAAIRCCLAVVSVIAWRTASRHEDRRLAGQMAVFFCINAVSTTISNAQSIWDRLPFTRFGDILFPCAALALIASALIQDSTRTVLRKRPPTLPRVMPLVYTSAIVVCCLPLLHRYLLPSAVVTVIALCLFSLRLILQHEELELRHASLADGQRTLHELATTDHLTGIANRRCFLDSLVQNVDRVRRHRDAFLLVLFDIDNLKRINDHQGHLAGDECLREFANAVTSTANPLFEHFARFGGDEFVLILPAFESAEAERLIQQVRLALRDTQVRFSFGLASSPPRNPCTPTELLATADADLYRDKRQRANQRSK